MVGALDGAEDGDDVVGAFDGENDGVDVLGALDGAVEGADVVGAFEGENEGADVLGALDGRSEGLAYLQQQAQGQRLRQKSANKYAITARIIIITGRLIKISCAVDKLKLVNQRAANELAIASLSSAR